MKNRERNEAILNNENRELQLHVQGNMIGVMKYKNIDYISLTDLARYKNPKNPGDVIIKWMSNKSSFDYYCLWEELFNDKFKLAESREFKKYSSIQSFTMSPSRWINETNAIGFTSKRGKYCGGTFAHPDIALEFASWIDSAFKLYLIKEFERLKQNESYQKEIMWSVRRELAKTNYKIHTDSIKENLIPTLTDNQKLYVYSNEADVLNIALFGITAKQWQEQNPNLKGNIRDYANTLQLVILSNLENLNAKMIEDGIEQNVRIEKLNHVAKKQYQILQNDIGIENIETLNEKSQIEKLK